MRLQTVQIALFFLNYFIVSEILLALYNSGTTAKRVEKFKKQNSMVILIAESHEGFLTSDLA